MGRKPKKLNTPENVQTRIMSLEENLRDMEPQADIRRSLPEYRFSSVAYENTVLDYLRLKQVPFNREPIVVGSQIERTVLDIPQSAALTPLQQEQLDITERVYRLSSKILLTIRPREDPTPYNANVVRALAPLQRDNTLAFADRVSDIFSGDSRKDESKGDVVRTAFVDGLNVLIKKYNLPTLTERRTNKRGYIEALGDLIGAAEKLAAEIIDGAKGVGEAVKKRDTVHRMAEANRAFAHFKW